MALAPGTRLGPYEIAAQIGVGGMGEVYRATDTNLGRQVAIKVLPDAFAQDAERLARFEREAKTLASLNHPNIAIIHGLEKADGARALVMELVEGPTLADRIAQGPIPLDETLPIARQIAEALEAAHEQGIIHRDLKPANIKVRPDGTVKVLDFGLAKAMEPSAMSASASMSPTITTPAMTQAGMILGTAAYMSPEQARGKPVDKRADMWAFGCVLYEMLTGRRAFEAEDVSLTLAEVMKSEPDLGLLPAQTPVGVRQALGLCLQKNPKQRGGDIAAIRLALEGTFEPAPPQGLTGRGSASPLWRRALPFAAVALAATLAGAGAVWLRPSGTPDPLVRALIDSPAVPVVVSANDRDIAIAPDGSMVAYLGGQPASRQVFVRRIAELDPVLVYSGAGSRGLFFSPDGEWIGFFDVGANTVLRRVSISGGSALTLAEAVGLPRGASWGSDGTIVFATNDNSKGLQRVGESGGAPEVLTTPQTGERGHWWPEVLPDGRAVLFTVMMGNLRVEEASVAVADLRTRTTKVLVQGASHGRYVDTGHLLYASGSTLWAVPFDLERLEVNGTAVPVVPDIAVTNLGAANFDVASNGILTYVRGNAAASVRRSLVWVDRAGREEPINAPPRGYSEARLSPDGTRLALDVRDEENDIWLWDLMRETLTRLTFTPDLDRNPVWSPDGARIAHASGERQGEVVVRRADGTGTPEVIKTDRTLLRPKAFSPDGTHVIVWEQRPGTGTDLLRLPLGGANSPSVEALLQTPFNEDNADISRDGHWLAYQSNESGTTEIYVRPYPNLGGGRWQISNGGGSRPVWASSGRELFFLDGAGVITAVPIQTSPAFSAGAPVRLHSTSYYPGPAGRSFDVTSDGRRFVVIKDSPGGEGAVRAPSLILVQGWFDELRRLVPVD